MQLTVYSVQSMYVHTPFWDKMIDDWKSADHHNNQAQYEVSSPPALISSLLVRLWSNGSHEQNKLYCFFLSFNKSLTHR